LRCSRSAGVTIVVTRAVLLLATGSGISNPCWRFGAHSRGGDGSDGPALVTGWRVEQADVVNGRSAARHAVHLQDALLSSGRHLDDLAGPDRNGDGFMPVVLIPDVAARASLAYLWVTHVVSCTPDRAMPRTKGSTRGRALRARRFRDADQRCNGGERFAV
jgi:hypothetical protein